MNRGKEKKVGLAFWMGTLFFGLITWISIAVLTGETAIPTFAVIIFCWLGGLIAQVVVDLILMQPRPRFVGIVCRWGLFMLVYYVLIALIVYWVSRRFTGNTAFYIALVLGLLPILRLLPHAMLENARLKQKRDSDEARD